MKTSTRILTGAALLVAALAPSFGQTAKTKPVGYRTETLGSGFSLLGVNLAEKVEAAGTLNAATATTVTDNDANFTALGTDDLLLKITTTGALYQANATSATTLTVVSGDVSALTGATYEVRKSSTVASLFGATNSAGLTAGAELANADNIYIPTGSGFAIVYYSDGSGFDPVGWRDSSGADASGFEIPYSTSFFVRNSQATAKSVVFTGHVITDVTKVPVKQNFNYVSRILPVDVTLDQSTLKDQLDGGAELATSDNIYVPTGPGAYKIYYYSDGSGFDPVGWNDGSGVVKGGDALSSGYLILRRSATAKDVNVVIPAGLDL